MDLKINSFLRAQSSVPWILKVRLFCSIPFMQFAVTTFLQCREDVDNLKYWKRIKFISIWIMVVADYIKQMVLDPMIKCTFLVSTYCTTVVILKEISKLIYFNKTLYFKGCLSVYVKPSSVYSNRTQRWYWRWCEKHLNAPFKTKELLIKIKGPCFINTPIMVV